jgi:hypothetical protein
VGTHRKDAAVGTLDALIGSWDLEISHPSHPSHVIEGRADFERLDGGHFVVERWQIDHPDFPNGLAVYDAATQHYFDARGVARVYEMSIADGEWTLARDGDDFSQRFTGHFSDGGSVIDGYWEMARDGTTFERDFDLTFRKVS